MLLDMLPEMPEGIDDIALWRPLSYVEHFEESRLADRHLAIAAYAAAPAEGRAALEGIARDLNQIMANVVDAVLMAMASGQHTLAHQAAQDASAVMKPLIRQASDVINGVAPQSQTGEVMSQASIDSLFD